MNHSVDVYHEDLKLVRKATELNESLEPLWIEKLQHSLGAGEHYVAISQEVGRVKWVKACSELVDCEVVFSATTDVKPSVHEYPVYFLLSPSPNVSCRKSESLSEWATASLPSVKRRTLEVLWRENNIDELRKYAGNWVALEGEEIVAHGKNLSTAISAARAKGIQIPYVFYVNHSSAEAVRMGF